MNNLPSPSFAHVVGLNVRAIREQHGVSQDSLASTMRSYGMTTWQASRVGELENGRLGLYADALVVLAQSLGDLTRSPVTISSLLAGDAGIAVAGSLRLRNRAVQATFEGAPVDFLGADDLTPLPDLTNVRSGMRRLSEQLAASPELRTRFDDGLAARRAARRLGVAPELVTATAIELWGVPLTEQRDRVAGDGASDQRRGIVTRQLVDELGAALRERGEGASDGDR